MSTVRQDEKSVYVIANGHKVRPMTGGESKGDSHMETLDGERWGKSTVVRSRGQSYFPAGTRVVVSHVSQSPRFVVIDKVSKASELWFANEKAG